MIVERQEKNEKLIKTALATALVAGGVFLLYRKVKIDWDGLIARGYQVETLQASVKPVFDRITRNDSFQRKMPQIKREMAKDNWVSRYGASLALFGELEGFLEGMLKKHKLKTDKRSLKEKLGPLRGQHIIDENDYRSLIGLVEIRNDLVHGRYGKVTNSQLKNSYEKIEIFVLKYSKKRIPKK